VELRFDVRSAGERRALITAEGKMTAVTVGPLRTKLKSLATGGTPEVILDLSRVLFLDSSGLAALVSGLKAAREAGGWLRLAGMSDDVKTVFKLTLLDRVFELYPDVETARAGGAKDSR
jgi:anti-sigma B factor antagonist